MIFCVRNFCFVEVSPPHTKKMQWYGSENALVLPPRPAPSVCSIKSSACCTNITNNRQELVLLYAGPAYFCRPRGETLLVGVYSSMCFCFCSGPCNNPSHLASSPVTLRLRGLLPPRTTTTTVTTSNRSKRWRSSLPPLLRECSERWPEVCCMFGILRTLLHDVHLHLHLHLP